jgi:hypothetical protein
MVTDRSSAGILLAVSKMLKGKASQEVLLLRGFGDF